MLSDRNLDRSSVTPLRHNKWARPLVDEGASRRERRRNLVCQIGSIDSSSGWLRDRANTAPARKKCVSLTRERASMRRCRRIHDVDDSLFSWSNRRTAFRLLASHAVHDRHRLHDCAQEACRFVRSGSNRSGRSRLICWHDPEAAFEPVRRIPVCRMPLGRDVGVRTEAPLGENAPKAVLELGGHTHFPADRPSARRPVRWKKECVSPISCRVEFRTHSSRTVALPGRRRGTGWPRAWMPRTNSTP